jgi:dTMP kinase|tara:strand:+ start:190 stop:789 length:600 start_codon:yes stop_codon:yes gene_type:complete
MHVISFEGFEYSGKSTQIALLKKYFSKQKIVSTFTREPGGNKDLEKIRKIILQSDFDNLSLILFFFASRFSLLSTLKSKGIVVFDRFFDSTYAYQNYTSRDRELILNLIKQVHKKYIPRLTFYFKMNKKTLLERKNKRGAQNKFDKKYLGEFSRIQKNYNDLSKIKINKRIFITIDASQSKELIHQEIIENLKKWKLIK